MAKKAQSVQGLSARDARKSLIEYSTATSKRAIGAVLHVHQRMLGSKNGKGWKKRRPNCVNSGANAVKMSVTAAILFA